MKVAKRFAVMILIVLLNVALLTAAFAVEGEVLPASESQQVTEAEKPKETAAPTSKPTEAPTQKPTQKPTEAPTTKPTQPKVTYIKIDYSALNLQLTIAEGLKQSDYTTESWKVLQDACEAGRTALKQKKQSKVDTAAENLTKAIADLVKMDYSKLWAVLMEVGELDNPDDVYQQWSALIAAVESGKELMTCGDQEAVDAATQSIRDALTEVEAYLKKVTTPQVVVKEVEVEVPPSGEYCNIPVHQIWPMAFAASAVVNLVLLIVLVSVLRKKQKQMDDTPLIDYDIDDDFDE